MSLNCDEAAARQRDIQRLLQELCKALGVNIDTIGLEAKL